MKPKYPRAAALAVAKELCYVLRQATDRLKVAGSLRRLKEEVGDIEMVFVPKVTQEPDPADLFGALVPCDWTALVINRMVASGALAKRAKSDGTFTWGAEIKLAVHVASGIPVDFFAARPENWWNLLVCRTGSKESNERICNAAIARGWKWQPYGPGFVCRHTGRQEARVTCEAEAFTLVGLPALEPWRRE